MRKFNKSDEANDRIDYSNKRREYKELRRVKKINLKQKILDTLNNATTSPKEFWGRVKVLTRKKVTTNQITTQEWFNHFNKLFNELEGNGAENLNIQDDANVDVDITMLEGDISEDEVLAAIRTLKNGKAAGPDGIISEFFKHSAIKLLPFLVSFFNKLYATGSYPTAWTESIIQPIHKKGDVNKPDNYRGISLLNIISKIYTEQETCKLVGNEQFHSRKPSRIP